MNTKLTKLLDNLECYDITADSNEYQAARARLVAAIEELEAFTVESHFHSGLEIRRVADAIHLEQTCGGCPEQYDAVLNGQTIGYLRLRHGGFRVEYPECGGKEVYYAHPEGDGSFRDHERDRYLEEAKYALARAHLEPKEEKEAL